jgi:hypothetical protein
MGMLDSELVFSAAQSTAAFAIGDNPSSNVYDTGSAYNNAQDSEAAQTNENLWVNVVCNTLFVAVATGTVQAVLQTAPDNATWTDTVAGKATLVSTIVAGQVLLQIQPPPGTQRYWRTILRVALQPVTAGAVDSYISNTIQYNVQRPSGFTVA